MKSHYYEGGKDRKLLNSLWSIIQFKDVLSDPTQHYTS